MNWSERPVTLQNVIVREEDETILDGIDLILNPGKVTALVGSSGCGKSTLLKVAAGLIPIAKGTVLYGESKIYKLSQKEFARVQTHTGFMFQDGALWANKNIFDNLSLPLAVGGASLEKGELEQRVFRALDSFGMRERAAHRPAALSAGERKIVSFLRAVIGDPQILFLDEPATYVDRRSARLLINRLFQFKKEGKTLLIVTHDMNLVRRLADYLVFMHQGRVVLNDSVERALESPDPLFRSFREDLSPDEDETPQEDIRKSR